MQDPLTLYKLIILYMLQRVDFSTDEGADQRLYFRKAVYKLSDAPAGYQRAD